MMLHIWDNGCDWVCAESAEDADRVWHEFSGESSSDGHKHEWEQVPDEKLIGFWCNADGTISEPGDNCSVVKKPAREWAEAHGRGFLGSTEY